MNFVSGPLDGKAVPPGQALTRWVKVTEIVAGRAAGLELPLFINYVYELEQLTTGDRYVYRREEVRDNH